MMVIAVFGILYGMMFCMMFPVLGLQMLCSAVAMILLSRASQRVPPEDDLPVLPAGFPGLPRGASAAPPTGSASISQRPKATVRGNLKSSLRPGFPRGFAVAEKKKQGPSRL